MFLIATISFFDTIRELGFSINRAFEKMEREMVVKTIMNVAILVLGIIFLKINLSPKSMALAYAVGSGIGAFIIIFMIRNETKQLIGTVDRKKVGTLLKTAWPFAFIFSVSSFANCSGDLSLSVLISTVCCFKLTTAF
jgi:O-antigen/teichoic acid export membrane protein